MPKGVEHIPALGLPRLIRLVREPLMPKGVEHIRSAAVTLKILT